MRHIDLLMATFLMWLSSFKNNCWGIMCPPPLPCWASTPAHLSSSETLSLKHYLAWSDTHDTVKAYNAHAQVLSEATQEEILSLYKVKQLAMDLTGICTLIAAWHLLEMPRVNQLAHIVIMAKCTEPCYKSVRNSRAKPKPRATMLYMPITPIIQAFYANVETTKEMQHRDRCL